MASKLEQFLTNKKINRSQLLAVSKDLEGLRPEDRAIKLAKRQGKGEGNEGKVKETRKVRSGRPVSETVLSKIFLGKDVAGPTKTRVLRAVNAILERKKQDKAQLADLFDLGTGKPKSEKKAE
jgi:hypothetical protein